MNDPQKAGPFFHRASQLPGAPYIFTMLASNYLAKQDSKAAAQEFLESMLKSTTDEKVKAKIWEKIQNLGKAKTR
jgi:hypothetical protein